MKIKMFVQKYNYNVIMHRRGFKKIRINFNNYNEGGSKLLKYYLMVYTYLILKMLQIGFCNSALSAATISSASRNHWPKFRNFSISPCVPIVVNESIL